MLAVSACVFCVGGGISFVLVCPRRARKKSRARESWDWLARSVASAPRRRKFVFPLSARAPPTATRLPPCSPTPLTLCRENPATAWKQWRPSPSSWSLRAFFSFCRAAAAPMPSHKNAHSHAGPLPCRPFRASRRKLENGMPLSVCMDRPLRGRTPVQNASQSARPLPCCCSLTPTLPTPLPKPTAAACPASLAGRRPRVWTYRPRKEARHHPRRWPLSSPRPRPTC